MRERRTLKFDANAGPGVYPMQYFNYPDYQDKKAADKMTELWSALEAD